MSEHLNTYHHIPVLLKASVENLITDPNGVYVDVTFGGGGHSKEILSKISNHGKLFAFDKDQNVLNHIPKDERFEIIFSDFRYLKKYMEYYKIEKLDGILADLGLSSHHIDETSRGFSIFSDKPLDMRMNTNQTLTAKNVLMQYSEQQLEFLIKTFGELTNARIIAKQLVKDRNKKSFNSCKEFANWAEMFAYGKKVKFLAQLFQAFRIEVNREIDSLQDLLKQGSELLKTGGRMVVISYHSLEDRKVKQWFKTGSPELHLEGMQNSEIPFKSLYKQAILPDENELILNSRARSAKMRIGVKQ
ncbi:MAG: 16S rRNA (cytosine(1402)-N(4))-methyltransferase RsmH [Saprospiraceae bacterium]|nr:16S rRNA (cytosine(1402)-N(4))-methyltransferase RsmH [Saprospiraceae bacterium]MBK9729256.1 16S rRNA (cytosine(1402)-N(4))-methyltransferase RsmH [Saprospiraceae bacterium]